MSKEIYAKLNAVIDDLGFWDGRRRASHAFLLSPDVYRINRVQKRELEHLGHVLFDCLLGLSHMASIAYDPRLNYQNSWLYAHRVFSSGVPAAYHRLHGVNVKDIPKLLKVDLMVGQRGNFKIAEIDGHNKHGLGYSTLAKLLRDQVCRDGEVLPGTVALVAQEISRLGFASVKLLYGDQERFYVPEFEVAVREFTKHGIQCDLMSEMDADEDFVREGLFLDLPFMNQRHELSDLLMDAYMAGRAQFIIPPKPCLGAKGLLAFMRNDTGDEDVEALLRTFINAKNRKTLEKVRHYIPETLLVGKMAAGFNDVMKRLAGKRYVLKESISSGMKGTVFSDDPEFQTVLEKACRSNMNWILQEEVDNLAQTFSWYENGAGNTSQMKMEYGWFMRVTVQYVNRQLADVVVTARRDKSVHGAKDCLQIGTVVG